MTQLNQVLAIEKGIKTRATTEKTNMHRVTQKASLMNGHTKRFQPKEEGGETFPPENQIVQVNYRDVFDQLQTHMVEFINITGTKDWTNCEAKADLKVEGKVIATGVPATHLLFLETQLNDMHTFVSKMAELDPGEEWSWDANSGFHRTREQQQHRTKKMQKPLVLHPPTKEHPAQTTMVTEDVIIGYWNTVKISGAIPKSEKRKLLARVEQLRNAVKMAREEANRAEAQHQHHGAAVMNFIFDGVFSS